MSRCECGGILVRRWTDDEGATWYKCERCKAFKGQKHGVGE